MNCKYALTMALFLGFLGFLYAFSSPVFTNQDAHHTQDDTEVGAQEEGSVPRVGEPGVTPPVFTSKSTPVYPKKAKKEQIQGYVILEAVMYKNGKIGDIKVLRGLGEGQYGFDEAAVAAISKWKFKPGSVNGKPADVKITLKVDFFPPAG